MTKHKPSKNQGRNRNRRNDTGKPPQIHFSDLERTLILHPEASEGDGRFSSILQEPTKPEIGSEQDMITKEDRKALISAIKDTKPLKLDESKEENLGGRLTKRFKGNKFLRRMLAYRDQTISTPEQRTDVPVQSQGISNLDPKASSHLNMMIALHSVPLVIKASGPAQYAALFEVLGSEVEEKITEIAKADEADAPMPEAIRSAIEDSSAV
jgi:hypothetical protein